MSQSELEKKLVVHERIRDIILNAGICSELQDEQLARICSQIDALYQEQIQSIGNAGKSNIA